MQKLFSIVIGSLLITLPVSAYSKDEDLFIRPSDHRTIVFSSLDLARSPYATIGAKWAMTGRLDRPGPIMTTSLGYGGKQERSSELDSTLYIKNAGQTSVLYGYQFMVDRTYLAFSLGPEMNQEQYINSDGLASRVSEPRLGARMQWDLWAYPHPDVLATTTLIAGTARGHIWGRSSLGYKISNVFLGPEGVYALTESEHEWRMGAHVTGVSIKDITLNLSSGWRWTEQKRGGMHVGPYLGLSAHMPM